MAGRIMGLPECTIFWCAALHLAGCAQVPTASIPSESPSEKIEAGARADWVKPLRGEATAEYHYSLAQAYSADGQVDRAIEEYRLTLAYDPKSAWVHTRLAAEWVRKGDVAQALDASRKAVELDPKLIDARMILAGIQSASRESEAAIREYSQVLKLDPRHEEAAIYKSQIHSELGQTDEARTTLHALLKRNADSHLGWFSLARVERQAERWSAAVEAYRRAIQIKPGFSQAYLGLGFLHEERGQNDLAKKIYRQGFERAQDNACAHRLATILLKEEKYTEAEPYLESVALADPEDLNVRVKLGLVRMELKKLPQAVQAFEEVLSRSPDSDRVLYYLGNVHEEMGATDRAVGALSRITAESKLYADARIHLAFLKKQAGDVDGARKIVADALVAAPRLVSLHLYRATIEDEAGNSQQLLSILEEAAKLFPEDERVRFFLGSVYDREGRVDEGIAQMEAIVKTNPDHAEALNYLGYTYTLRGVRLSDAERFLKRAIQAKPDNAYIIDSWGWYLFTVGRVNESVTQLEKAMRLKSDEPTILEHLADAYLRTGFGERALKLYAEAARLTAKEGERQKIVAKLDALRLRLGRNAGVRVPAAEKP